MDVTPYSLVEIWRRFEGICLFHFQGAAVPSRGTLLFRIKVSAGVGHELASCTVLLTHAVCAGAGDTRQFSFRSCLFLRFPVQMRRTIARPECDFSGAGLTHVPEHGRCHGMSRRMQAFYAIKLWTWGHDKGSTCTTVVSPTVMLPVKFGRLEQTNSTEQRSWRT